MEKLWCGRSSETLGCLQSGSSKPSENSGGESSILNTLFTVVLTPTGDLVRWWKEHIEDLLNPIVTPSIVEFLFFIIFISLLGFVDVFC